MEILTISTVISVSSKKLNSLLPSGIWARFSKSLKNCGKEKEKEREKKATTAKCLFFRESEDCWLWLHGSWHLLIHYKKFYKDFVFRDIQTCKHHIATSWKSTAAFIHCFIFILLLIKIEFPFVKRKVIIWKFKKVLEIAQMRFVKNWLAKLNFFEKTFNI